MRAEILKESAGAHFIFRARACVRLSLSLCDGRIGGSTFVLQREVLEFNDTSTLVGHFVSSPWEREKRDRTGKKDEQE